MDDDRTSKTCLESYCVHEFLGDRRRNSRSLSFPSRFDCCAVQPCGPLAADVLQARHSHCRWKKRRCALLSSGAFEQLFWRARLHGAPLEIERADIGWRPLRLVTAWFPPHVLLVSQSLRFVASQMPTILTTVTFQAWTKYVPAVLVCEGSLAKANASARYEATHLSRTIPH